MSLLTVLLVTGAVAAVEYALNRFLIWRQRQGFMEEHGEYMHQVEQMDAEYKPEEPDRILADKCNEYLNEQFPNGMRSKFENMSKEEIVEFFKKMESDAEELLEVKGLIKDVDFYETDTPPECGYFGYYCETDQSFHLNIAYLTCGNMDMVIEQVYTIFHELKHARQWSAVLGRADYGYSDEQLKLWGDNMLHYIPPFISDELYRKQPLERDSWGFESLLKKGRQ